MQSLQAVPEILVSSPPLWAKIIRFTDISDTETRSSVHNWCETTGCREFKSEVGSCCPKNWIYPTLVTKEWFQELTADHEKAFLPTWEKEINGAGDKGEILVLKWNFSKWYGVKMAILAVPWKVRMAAVSEGKTGGVVAIAAQIAAINSYILWKQQGKQATSHVSSTFPPSSTTLLYFPFSGVGAAWSWPQSRFLIPGTVLLHSAQAPDKAAVDLSRVSLQNLSPAGSSCPADRTGGCRSFPALSLPRHNGDPLKKPPLHLCLSASALRKKINIAVCC